MILKKREMYCTSLIMVVVLWISTIVFKISNLGGFIPEIFLWVFALIVFVYISDYKRIIKDNKVTNTLNSLVAINFVASMSYILCMAFMYGRYIIRLI